jgi:hypothetical protein
MKPLGGATFSTGVPQSGQKFKPVWISTPQFEQRTGNSFELSAVSYQLSAINKREEIIALKIYCTLIINEPQ